MKEIKVHYGKDHDLICEQGHKFLNPLTTKNKKKVTCKVCLAKLNPPTHCKNCNKTFKRAGRYGKTLLCKKCGAKKNYQYMELARKERLAYSNHLGVKNIENVGDPRWLRERAMRKIHYQLEAEKYLKEHPNDYY